MVKEDKQHCVFCKIIAGTESVSLVYEDDRVMVFPPLQPVNPGHLLIIPKKNVPYFADLDEDH
jgi:histidine triad (HIT) family protein